jgi:NAD(P)-dependent dehydrogenase (short-subunit alcohol dehydrogenase family)
VIRLFNTVDAEFGPITVLVNNASILKTQCRLEDMTAERINAVLINNITSYFLCSREAVKRMSTQIHADGGEANRIERLQANIPMLRGG